MSYGLPSASAPHPPQRSALTAGKAIHIRDTVTFSNVIDTFVPFAKRTRAISRHVLGTVLAKMGRLVVAFIPAGPPRRHSAAPTATSSPVAPASGVSSPSPSPLIPEDSLQSAVEDDKSAPTSVQPAQYPLPEMGDSSFDLMGDSVRGEDVVSQDSSPTNGFSGPVAAEPSQTASGDEEKQ